MPQNCPKLPPDKNLKIVLSLGLNYNLLYFFVQGSTHAALEAFQPSALSE
jgi:hypothetical protein